MLPGPVIFAALLLSPALRAQKQVVVGFGHVPPIAYRGTDGQPAGFGIDVLNEAARREGIALAWRSVGSSDDIDDALEKGRIDLHYGGMPTPERRRRFYVSEPWWSLELTLLYPAGGNADLRGKKLALAAPAYRTLADRFPGALLLVPQTPRISARSAATTVCTGEADAALLTQMDVYEFLLDRPRPCLDLELRTAQPDAKIDLCLLAGRGREALGQRLRRRISELTADGTLTTFAARYPPIPTRTAAQLEILLRDRYNLRLLGIGMASAILLLLLSVVFLLLQRRAHRDVQASRAMLGEVLSAIPAMVSTYRGERHLLEFANPPQIAAFHGRNPVGKPLREAYPEMGEAAFAIFDRVLASGEPFTSAALPVSLDADGNKQEVFLKIAVLPRRDAAGSVVGVTGFAFDVTEPVRAQMALGEMNQRLALLAGAGRHLLAFADPDSFIRELFEQVSKLTGLEVRASFFARESAFRLHSYAGIGKAQADCLLELRQTVCGLADGTERVAFEHISESGDPRLECLRALGLQAWTCIPLEAGGRLRGTMGFGTRTRPVFNADDLSLLGAVAGLVGVALERDRLDRELAAKNRELERSNSDLTQFAYAVSHDLIEPLRAVGGFTGLLARRFGPKLDGEAAEFIGCIQDGVRRMQAMIEDLLDYSRVIHNSQNHRAPADCNKVLAEALANLEQPVSSSGAVIEAQPLPTLELNAALLARVFQNLIGNAIKYRKPDEAPRVRVWADQGAGEWVFSVADNGIGIDPKHAERIFGVFQRLHSASDYPGTGVGLAITKRIVERHGGRIWVESKPGAGSTFKFSIASPPRT